MNNVLKFLGLFAAALSLSGFDFIKHSISPDEIRGGGPPKDGIPAILDPQFIPATKPPFWWTMTNSSA